MEEKLDNKIKSKIDALQRLTAKLNKAEDDTKKGLKKLDTTLEERRDEVYRHLAELEKRLADPEESITTIHEELRSKEQNLRVWRYDLHQLSDDIADREELVNEHEELLTTSGDELLHAWTEFIQSMYGGLKDDLDSIRIREETLTSRRKSIDNRQGKLQNQILTFKTAQKEILNKSNG